MLTTLSVKNYRSVLDLTLPLGRLNVITGPNGSGKSNLYKALRLLARAGQGGVVNALAMDGGMDSVYWAGPERLSRAMRQGDVPVEGIVRQNAMRLKLGFSADDYGYAITLGLPEPLPYPTPFNQDPEIKRECIWHGAYLRPAGLLVERNGPMVRVRQQRQWRVVAQHLAGFDSMFDQVADIEAMPELFTMREKIRRWRFYDHFRTDKDAPARQPQLGTRTPVLHHDGRDLAAAIQTIIEIGDEAALHHAVDYAFPGAHLQVTRNAEGRFFLTFHQHGLLRPLSVAELSDGTLRYLLWVAALLTPRPPELMVLNEPETSLHPDLLPALGRLILHAAEHSQVWVVTHAPRLIATLEEHPECHSIQLDKQLGATGVPDLHPLDVPAWHWPD